MLILWGFPVKFVTFKLIIKYRYVNIVGISSEIALSCHHKTTLLICQLWLGAAKHSHCSWYKLKPWPQRKRPIALNCNAIADNHFLWGHGFNVYHLQSCIVFECFKMLQMQDQDWYTPIANPYNSIYRERWIIKRTPINSLIETNSWSIGWRLNLLQLAATD